MQNTLHDRLSRLAALRPSRQREAVAETRVRQDADQLAMLLGAEIRRNRYGQHLAAQQWHAVNQACEPDARVLRLLLPCRARTASHEAERAVEHACDSSRWLFLDTETTGLAGGTGTYAFLVGLAWWDAGGLHIEQLFMRDYGEEHSLLLEIARRLRERPVLVTFNGKSFDWPLLETRFRMTRAIEPPRLAAHLDLLHPARQIWRMQLGSVRLAELERGVLGGDALGWSRADDVDSSRIPEVYFDYLRGGAAEPLAGVFRHNRMDLRGLAALAGRVFRMLAEPERIGSAPDASLELYGVSRLLGRRGERARACALYELALAAGLPAAVDHSARHELARLARREGDFARAAGLWAELAGGATPSFEACEQLAIHCERRAGDPAEAARVVRMALAKLRRAQRLGLIAPHRCAHWLGRFEQRLARLHQKSSGLSAGGALESQMRASEGENARAVQRRRAKQAC
jgi:uncharacterized protein YprB with RNaseH-like and TPR domain